MKTLKRDYVERAELRDAATVMAQLGWFNDHSIRARPSALGMRSRVDYRTEQLTASCSR